MNEEERREREREGSSQIEPKEKENELGWVSYNSTQRIWDEKRIEITYRK